MKHASKIKKKGGHAGISESDPMWAELRLLFINNFPHNISNSDN